ncbi:TetR/AcrR family transcriptional regulator [Streptomyces sp. NPDC048172]|uniref:TetR/AcrR family transcriptional regulator n=1 Tax=Streptomyces sp. NPDC048172 TaxID=3365505 RepID=UPI0037167B75
MTGTGTAKGEGEHADTGAGEGPDADAGAGADADAGAGTDAGARRGQGAPVRRGRPRSEAVERAIVDAVLHLLEEGTSIDALTVEGIARTAGVGKAAVYRRWSGKDELLLEVLRELEEPAFDGPTDGPVREILVAVLEWQRRMALAKRESALLRAMTGHVKSHPRLWEQYHDTVIKARREMLQDVLRRAVASGELRDDLDLAVLADLITGPMLVRIVLRPWDDVPEELPRELVDGVLEGVRRQP